MHEPEGIAPLAMTDRDHWKAGSTPPDILNKHPGKPQGELLTKQEIEEYLQDCKKQIERTGEKAKANPAFELTKRALERNLELDKEYLERIGRLPGKFGENE